MESDSEERAGGAGGATEPVKPPRNIPVSASPKIPLDPDADRLSPESYKVNSIRETRMLAIADNYQRQFAHLFPDRKQLLLCPVNECGVKKFVSTTIRPTLPAHPELLEWQGCASFVADFVSVTLLDPPGDTPQYLFSPTSVLRSQRATCVESATLLCSLLLGANYDAYCVLGYASREMCLVDQSLQEFPLLGVERANSQPETDTMVPKRELKSRFLIQQEKKKRDAEAVLLQEVAQEEIEQRPDDPLRGLWVHCWVLVMSGCRSIKENFIIDPLTGNSYPTNDDNFLGVESIWNNFNYYANMQDCSNGCADMVYILKDLNRWEPVLFGATTRKQLNLDLMKRREQQLLGHINEEKESQPWVFDMPTSWVSAFIISKNDLESRWPGAEKMIRYRKAKLEKFALYKRPDGLVTRLTTFKDLKCTEVVSVQDWYQQRSDHLEERESNKLNNTTTERFSPGRHCHLLLHRYTDTEREMVFSSVRVDSLVRRVELLGEMTETFEGRDDYLCHRQVQFADTDYETDPIIRRLKKVVERFHRDRSKPADEDVAERVFWLAERRIEVTYHLADDRYIPSKRRFIKPRESTEIWKVEDFTADMASTYQADLSVKPLTTLSLYAMLLDLMKEEESTILQIRDSMKEAREIVASREQQDKDVQLLFSPWTAAGLAWARHLKEEMERLPAKEQRRQQEEENDILAPYLNRLGNPETLSAEDAKKLFHECLSEFTLRQVEDASRIQERYEKETKELKAKQKWYQQNQLHISKEQEEEYQEFCAEKTLHMRVAKKRLSMHKEAARQRHHDLEEKLRQDPRLAPHLLS